MKYLLNLGIVAGYNVLADKIPDHRKFVEKCFIVAKKQGIDLIFLVGGAINPDHPDKTEAEANYKIIKELKEFNDNKISVKVLPVGNTSAETLAAVKKFLKKKDILVNKLLLCAEQSRLAGFLLDALYVELLDMSRITVAYGHRFPPGNQEFDCQRKKILLKTLSHHIFLANFARKIYAFFHQRKVAKSQRNIKRA